MAVQLDARAFKALSSPTRVNLLKKLGVKPRSLTSLAEEAGLSVQATDEHMHKLVQAGLVEKDKHSKWAYYRLTASGRSLVEPNRQPVYLMLAVSFLLLLAAGMTWMQSPEFAASPSVMPQAMPLIAQESSSGAQGKAMETQADTAMPASAAAPAFGTPTESPRPSVSSEPLAAPAPSERAAQDVSPAAWPWTWIFLAASFVSLTLAIFWWRRARR